MSTSNRLQKCLVPTPPPPHKHCSSHTYTWSHSSLKTHPPMLFITPTHTYPIELKAWAVTSQRSITLGKVLIFVSWIPPGHKHDPWSLPFPLHHSNNPTLIRIWYTYIRDMYTNIGRASCKQKRKTPLDCLESWISHHGWRTLIGNNSLAQIVLYALKPCPTGKQKAFQKLKSLWNFIQHWSQTA